MEPDRKNEGKPAPDSLSRFELALFYLTVAASWIGGAIAVVMTIRES